MALRSITDRVLEHPLVYAAWQAPFVAQKFAPIERRIRHDNIRRVLDVGCGPGTNAARFETADYVGIDINEQYLTIARSRHRGRFLQADLATGDLPELGTFDTILVNSFLHHLPDAEVDRILDNIERRLDAEGKVHILELVLPERGSMARLMAKLDRGRYARPLAVWSECFRRHFEPVVEEPSCVRRGSLGDDLLSGAEEAMRLSVGVPVFNEQEGIPVLLDRLLKVLDGIPGGPHEVVLVDDGSTDGSRRIMEEAAQRDRRLKIVVLSRNFGHQAALGAALDHATGDTVVLMDADLQDPPEAIPEFFRHHEAGADVVFARRVSRKEGPLIRAAYKVFYRIMAVLAETDLPLDSGDFALLGAPVVAALRRLPEHQRYLRGLRAWVGFKQVGIDVPRQARLAGTPKYTTWKLIKLALDGLCSFSIVPLRAAAVAGFAAILASVGFGLYAVYVRIVLGQSPAGFTAAILITIFLSGVQLLFLGVIGEYLGRVYGEAKGRPSYVVAKITSAG